MDTELKVRENRLRRMADRQGFRYSVSRRRDPRAIDYGRVYLTNYETEEVIEFTPGYAPQPGWTVLDEVEAFLTRSTP